MQPSVHVDALHPMSRISKNIYGQFSEHLGRCIYQGPHIQERIRQLPTGLYVVRRNHQSIIYGK